MHSWSSARHSGGKRPPCVATPTSAVVGSYCHGVGDSPHEREAFVRRRVALRIEDAHDILRRVANDTACRLAEVRIARASLSKSRSLRGRNAEPRPIGRKLHAVDEVDARPWVVGEEQVPVEVDVIHEARDVRARRDPEPDSTMQPSITPRPSARAACTIRTDSRIPPAFASLMLIPCARSAQAATSASP